MPVTLQAHCWCQLSATLHWGSISWRPIVHCPEFYTCSLCQKIKWEWEKHSRTKGEWGKAGLGKELGKLLKGESNFETKLPPKLGLKWTKLLKWVNEIKQTMKRINKAKSETNRVFCFFSFLHIPTFFHMCLHLIAGKKELQISEKPIWA